VTAASGRAGLRRQAVALGLFAVLAIALTWPLASHFTTHVPATASTTRRWRGISGGCASVSSPGQRRHLPRRLDVSSGANQPGLLHADAAQRVAEHSACRLGLSLVVANNVVLLASLCSPRLGRICWCSISDGGWRHDNRCPFLRRQQRLMRRGQASATQLACGALAGGAIYAFASSKLFYASLGQFNIASSQWIPFCVLLLLRMVRPAEQRRHPSAVSDCGRGAGRALFRLSTVGRADLRLVSVDLCGVALLCGSSAQHGGVWRQSWQVDLLLPYLIVFGAIGWRCTAADFSGRWRLTCAAKGDFFASGGGFADVFSADLMGYLVRRGCTRCGVSGWRRCPFPNDKGTAHLSRLLRHVLLSVLGLWGLARRGDRRWRGCGVSAC
jgi:hypothetical protein